MAEQAPGSSRLVQWAGVAVLATLLFGRLGAYPLFDVDEGAFAEASREMLTSGDWGHTTLNGADRFDKPILVYWLQAVSMAVWGVNEWAVRFPSAMCAALSLWALARQASPWVPDASPQPWPLGWAAAWLLGTSAGFLLIGRAATADALLNLLLVLGGLRLAAFAVQGRPSDLTWAAFWLSLGVLTKGPVALLIPGATLLLWSTLTDRGQRLRQALSCGSTWGWVLGLCVPWYAYAWHRHGDAFIEGFFLRHNLQRFSGPLEGHGGSLAYYLVALPLLWLPWSVLLPAIAWHARRWWGNPLDRFLLIWAGFVLVFFSLSGTKLPHYALYAGWPLAILAARVWLDADTRRGWGGPLGWLLLASLVATVLVLATLTHLAPTLADRVPDPLIRRFLETAPGDGAVVAGAAIALTAMAALWIPRRLPPRFRQGLGAALLGGWLTWAVVPWWGETLQGPVKAAGLWAQSQAPQPFTQWALHRPSVGFYRLAATPRQAPAATEWGLTGRHRIDPTTHEVGFESRGLVWATPSIGAPTAGKAP